MDGHMILHRDDILGPTRVLMWDLSPLGSPEVLTAAHLQLRPLPPVPEGTQKATQT